MFLTLLVSTFLLALGVAFGVMKAFTKPINGILQRIIKDEISGAWSKYLKFAILVVGVSAGVRVYELEKYIAPSGSRETQAGLSFNRWVLEVYRTVIDTLQGIAWLLLVFFVFALVAFVVVRLTETKLGQAEEKSTQSTPEK